MRQLSPFTKKDVLIAIILSNHFWIAKRDGARGSFLKIKKLIKTTQNAEKRIRTYNSINA